jgi:hypothetical protein
LCKSLNALADLEVPARIRFAVRKRLPGDWAIFSQKHLGSMV